MRCSHGLTVRILMVTTWYLMVFLSLQEVHPVIQYSKCCVAIYIMLRILHLNSSNENQFDHYFLWFASCHKLFDYFEVVMQTFPHYYVHL